MKQMLNSDELRKWISDNGGHEAEAAILKATGFSLSTLQKMKDGSYQHTPNFASRRALTELTGIKMDVLFPSSKKTRKAS